MATRKRSWIAGTRRKLWSENAIRRRAMNRIARAEAGESALLLEAESVQMGVLRKTVDKKND